MQVNRLVVAFTKQKKLGKKCLGVGSQEQHEDVLIGHNFEVAKWKSELDH